jgi:hypothetical protein
MGAGSGATPEYAGAGTFGGAAIGGAQERLAVAASRQVAILNPLRNRELTVITRSVQQVLELQIKMVASSRFEPTAEMAHGVLAVSAAPAKERRGYPRPIEKCAGSMSNPFVFGNCKAGWHPINGRVHAPRRGRFRDPVSVRARGIVTQSWRARGPGDLAWLLNAKVILLVHRRRRPRGVLC